MEDKLYDLLHGGIDMGISTDLAGLLQKYINYKYVELGVVTLLVLLTLGVLVYITRR